MAPAPTLHAARALVRPLVTPVLHHAARAALALTGCVRSLLLLQLHRCLPAHWHTPHRAVYLSTHL